MKEIIIKIDIRNKLLRKGDRVYLNIDTAYKSFKQGRFAGITLDSFIPHGFYRKHLGFSEWLDYYNIKVY